MARLDEVALGVGLFPSETTRTIADLAHLADSLGYDRVYIGDSQLIWREGYMTMAAAALSTSRAAIGAGVTNCLTRNLTVVASAMATLDEMTDGRAFLGIGFGDSSVYTMNKQPASVAHLERAIQVIRKLYAGETVELDGGQVHIAYATPGKKLPVLVASSGPKALQMAGRCADGVILSGGLCPEFLDYNLRLVQQGAAQAGRDLRREGFKYIAWMPCCIKADGQAARDAVRAHVARVVNRPLPIEFDAETQRMIDRIRAEYDYHQHMAVGTHHGELVPDVLVEKFAIAGTPAECRSQLERSLELGQYIDELAIIPHATSADEKAAIMRALIQDTLERRP